MPELPEVETIVGKLRRGEPVERGLPAYPPLVGRVIIRAWGDWPRGAHPSASAIRRRLPGQRMASIGRSPTTSMNSPKIARRPFS